jgi:multiple sugar transport system permease protein
MEGHEMLRKAFIHLALALGALIFSVPFLWMVSTSLKPIDQTMAMPPTWLPYRYSLVVDGRQVAIRPGERLTSPAHLATGEAGERELKPGAPPDPGAEAIPASPEAPWRKVHFGEDGAASAAGAWDVVPEARIQRRIAPRWGNYLKAVKAMRHFPAYLRNTLILCYLTVVGTVISSALAAYGFARIEWAGRDRLFTLALGTMMVPFPVVMVPLYSLFRQLGMIGTLQPLWIGSFCAGAFNVFLLRQFFMTIPKDLSEAARIDGCSELMIFLRIILPISRPALMVVGLFQFMATWNDFLGPLIYLTDQKDFTLALGLQFFQSQHGGTEWHYLMAASVLVILPVITLFFFTQKTFIEGIAMTGVKG